MKNSPRLRETKRISKKKACISKCLAKDIKLSTTWVATQAKFYFIFNFYQIDFV